MKDGAVIDGSELEMLDEREHHAPDGPVWLREWEAQYRRQISARRAAKAAAPSRERASAMRDFLGEELEQFEHAEAARQLAEMEVGEAVALTHFRRRHGLPADEALTVAKVDAAVARREAERRKGAFAEFVNESA